MELAQPLSAALGPLTQAPDKPTNPNPTVLQPSLRVSGPTELEAEEQRRKRWRADEAWASGVRDIAGARYARARIDNFVVTRKEQAAAVSRLKKYLIDFEANCARGAGLLFIGPVGTGKDHLACAALRVIASEYMRTTRWLSGSDLFAEFRDLIRSEHRTESQAIAAYTAPDVLVLSDPLPPAGAVTEYQMGLLQRIVDGRYRKLRPTFATLNVASRTELEQRMGPQVTDRLFDNAIPIVCDWPSYRQPQMENSQ